jgi:hypothetical protein
MTRAQFTTQWKSWCDTLNQWPKQQPLTLEEIRHRWWYHRQESSNNWRLQPAGVTNLKKFNQLCPNLTVSTHTVITPKLILRLSKLTCPWSYAVHMQSQVPGKWVTPASLSPTIATFTVFGDQEVTWLSLCDMNFDQFMATWVTCQV